MKPCYASILLTSYLLLGTLLGSYGQNCANYKNRAEEYSQKIDQRNADYERQKQELKAGLFCSDCKRTKTEIERAGTNFGQHIADGARGGRHVVPATQEDFDKAHAAYLRDYENLKRNVEQSQQSYNKCVDDANTAAYNRQLEEARQRQAEAERNAKEQQQKADADRARAQQEAEAARAKAQQQAEAERQRQQRAYEAAQEKARQESERLAAMIEQQRETTRQQLLQSNQQLSNDNAQARQQVNQSMSNLNQQLANEPDDPAPTTTPSAYRPTTVFGGDASSTNNSLEETVGVGTAAWGRAIVDDLLERAADRAGPIPSRLLGGYTLVQNVKGAWDAIHSNDLVGLAESVPLPGGLFTRALILPNLRVIQTTGQNALDLLDKTVQGFYSDEDPELAEQRYQDFLRNFFKNLPTAGGLYNLHQKFGGQTPSNWVFKGDSL